MEIIKKGYEENGSSTFVGIWLTFAPLRRLVKYFHLLRRFVKPFCLWRRLVDNMLIRHDNT